MHTKYRPLTDIELKVLRLLAQGYLVKEVAEIFKRSPNSVGSTVLRIREKLFVPDFVNSQSILPLLALHIGKLEKIEPSPPELTPRRIEIIRLTTSGLSQADVAAEMGLSRVTVERHMKVVRKLVAAETELDRVNMVELTHWAIAHGITELKFKPIRIFNHASRLPAAAMAGR